MSIVIPVYNGAGTLRTCLERLFASGFKDFEVIVVDDASTDGSADVASAFPCRVIPAPGNIGPGPARNLGVRHSAGRILYFLDADIAIDPGVLEHLVRAFDQHPEHAAIFGCFEKNSGPANFVSRYKNLLHHYTHQTSHEEAVTFCSGLGAVRRDAFLDVQGFDPRWAYMEDVDLGYRLHRAGYRIWLDKELVSTHLKRYSLASLIRSDLFGRAIPWTRLMLESRRFHNDLNTKSSHVLSVAASFLLLAALAWKALWLPLALPLAVLFLFLNRAFLRFLLHQQGLWFALRSAALCWLGNLYSGVGAAAGLLAYLSGSSPAGAPANSSPRATEALAKAAKSGD